MNELYSLLEHTWCSCLFYMPIGCSIGERHVLHGENLRGAGPEVFLNLGQGDLQRWTPFLVIMLLKFLNGTIWNKTIRQTHDQLISSTTLAIYGLSTVLMTWHTALITHLMLNPITFICLPTKLQKWVWPACQGHCRVVKTRCEFPAQVFQEAEGCGSRETPCTYGHVGHTLGWEEATTQRDQLVNKWFHMAATNFIGLSWTLYCR